MNEIVKIAVGVVAGGALTAIGFLYKERVARKKESAGRRRDADVATLGAMRKLLPEAAVKFLREIEPYSGFPKNLIHAFDEFLQEFDRRNSVFHDAVLNSAALAGIAAVRTFNQESVRYVIPVGENYAVCPPNADYRDKPRYTEEANEVYRLAQQVHDSFLHLYDQARSRLVV